MCMSDGVGGSGDGGTMMHAGEFQRVYMCEVVSLVGGGT